MLHSIVVSFDPIEQIKHEFVALLFRLRFFKCDPAIRLCLIVFSVVDVWIQLGGYFGHETANIVNI